MDKLNYGLSVNLFHMLVVTPVLAYVGYYGAASSPQVFTALLALGILTAFYHIYRLYETRDVPFNYFKGINLFHVFIVAPLFLYVGYMGTKTEPQQLFTLLLILAPLVFLFHAFRAYQNSSTD